MGRLVPKRSLRAWQLNLNGCPGWSGRGKSGAGRKMARIGNKSAKRPKRKDSHAALDRGLNAALERRLKETPQDRQKAFGRVGRRPPGVRDGG